MRANPATLSAEVPVFGPIGGPEMVVILIIALLIFGPRRLPDLGRSLGKALSELRRASHDLKSTLEREIETEKHPPSSAPAGSLPQAAPAPGETAPGDGSEADADPAGTPPGGPHNG